MAHDYFESAPHFRPYRWAAPQFQVGLQPIADSNWLILDSDYPEFMRAKRTHIGFARDRYYKTMPTSWAAQRELRDMVTASLTRWHPALFSLSDGVLTCGALSWDSRDDAIEPLWQLSQFVQEDFMLLEESGGRVGITAASNAYSSSGRLVASVGRDVRWAHEPVPNLTAVHGARIERILASVHENAVCARFNWQLTPLASVFFPQDPHAANGAALKSVAARLERDPSLAPSLLYMRVERQTLRRLPATRAVAFSIHTYSDPLSTLSADPAALKALAMLLKSYSEERLRYTEMESVHTAVIAWLESLSAVHA